MIPLVTIAIPTYNRLDLLRETLDSVLSQTYSNIQIIISDNFSTDGTQEWLKNLELDNTIVIFQRENIGMVRNWNECLYSASGKFFLLLSDDDLLSPNAIENLVSVYFTYQNASIVYGKSVIFSQRDEITSLEGKRGSKTSNSSKLLNGMQGAKFTLDFFQGRISIYPCAILFRTEDLIQNGGFSTKFRLATDAFAWIKIVLNPSQKVYYCENALVYYRSHEKSQTKEVNKSIWLQEFKKLNTFFESKVDFELLHSSEYKRYLFRNKIREILGSSRSLRSRLSAAVKEYLTIRPPVKELVFCIFLAITPRLLQSKLNNLIRGLR